MRRERRRRANFYNQNNIKMTTKKIIIELTEEPQGGESLTIKNEGFTQFESIGILTHYIDHLTHTLRKKEEQTTLEKEMD